MRIPEQAELGGDAGRALAAALAGALALAACAGADDDVSPTPTAPGGSGAEDHTGPSIGASLIPDGQPRGVDVPIDATISDPSGVGFAAVYFRAVGTDYWASALFSGAGADAYRAIIPGSWVGEAGIDWYIEARDASPARNVSYFPPTGPIGPLYFSTLSDPLPFPFAESFEPEDPDTQRWLLGESGWTGYVRGFFDGQNWGLDDRFASDGSWSATHLHGSPYQVAPFEDWLVSPPIDLSAATTVDLYWQERVDHPEYATHRLMISTTSADPANEGFTAVLDPLPTTAGGDWLRSQHVDLSPWAGSPQVFIAFVYEGLWADDWYIDEVTLDLHQPDLSLGAASFEPTGIRPGQGAALSFDVLNAGLAATGPLSIQILPPDGDSLVQVQPSTLTVDPIGPGERRPIGPLSVTVGSGHANHTWIPFTVRMDDGVSQFEESVRLKVGRPAMAFVQITHRYENDIELSLGYAAGDARPYQQVVQQDGGTDGAGVFTWEIDLYDQRGAFPPNIADQRWFVEVGDDSEGNTGTLDVFYLAEGDDLFVAEGLPRDIPDDGSLITVWIPGRAELALAELGQTPEVAAPGVEVSLSPSVYNVAAPPRGPLKGSLRTGDPDVLGLTEAEIPFSYSAVTGQGEVGGIAVAEAPFTFTVSEAHQDSQPLAFTLLLSDGVDNWTLPITVPVPWPVLGAPSLIVADDEVEGAFEDYGLTPTETTALRVLALNSGLLPTFGAVTAAVRVVDDGGAGVVIPEGPYTLAPEPGEGQSGALKAGGRGKSGLIPVEVGLTTDVDTVITLEVTLSDGTLSRTDTVSMPLLEPARNPILAAPDAIGDASGTTWDLTTGGWQLRGNYLQMRWTSATAVDLASEVLYAYLSTDRNYRYAFSLAFGEALLFRWINTTDGGGYWTRQTSPPPSMVVVPVDARSVEVIVDLAEIGMAGRDLFGGASAGQCGGGFCDYAPASAAATGGLVPFRW